MSKQFTASQRRGILVFVLLLILFVGWRVRTAYVDSQTTLSPEITGSTDSTTTRGPEAVRVELNVADTALLQKVRGIGPTYARRIVRYRELIGGYTDPEQVMLATGMPPDRYVRVEPQVFVDTTTAAFRALRAQRTAKNAALSAAQRRAPARPAYVPRTSRRPDARPAPAVLRDSARPSPPVDKSPPPIININTADSLTLISLPGIGPWSAGKLLQFREERFFFRDLEDLRTAWFMREENWERIKDRITVGDTSQYRHIRINVWDVPALAAHRYVSWKAAKVIVAYRDQHGLFGGMGDCRKVREVDWDRLAGYLDFSPERVGH